MQNHFTFNQKRRDVLQSLFIGGAGLAIGFGVRGNALASDKTPAFAPNAFVRIGTDNSITVVCGKSEMGQGVLTGLAQIVAEELDAEWENVRFEQSPVHPDYANPNSPLMITGGSTSVRANWQRLRQAGAAARAVMVEAAARRWQVDKTALHTSQGRVFGPEKKSVSYGELVAEAAAIAVPQDPALKPAKDFKIIGKAVLRLDTPQKVNGTARFGIDTRLPDMLIAVMAFPPSFGAKVSSHDASAALAIPGVRHVHALPGGVAIVADNTWAAMKGREALKVEWDAGPLADLTAADIKEVFAQALDKPGVVDVSRGSAVQESKSITLEFEQPFLSQAPMEPMSCTVHIRPDGADVWTGTQAQTLAQRRVAEIAGLEPSRVRVHTLFLGGGFGRRSVNDFVGHTAEIAKVTGRPVKLIYTREDDMKAGYYRPFNRVRVTALLDEQGRISSYSAKTAVAAISKWTGFSFLRKANGVDLYATETLAPFYDIPNVEVRWVDTDIGVPIWFWRTPGGSQNCFAAESTVDELATIAGKDPIAFRRTMLETQPRHRAVLDLAASKSGWGKALPQGTARGIAMTEIFGTIVAQVAEVKLTEGRIHVARVVCALDCGIAINPQQVRAQVESSIVYGLTALLYGDVTIDKGSVQQSNFHDYQVLRMHEMPQIDVHIVPSTAAPGGMGEPALPPVLPAVANALRVLTGKRFTKLPLKLEQT